MDMPSLMNYTNLRCRGPHFPLPCDEEGSALFGSGEYTETEIKPFLTLRGREEYPETEINIIEVHVCVGQF